MTKNLIRLGAILFLILLPLVIRWIYLGVTAHPKQIVIATGRAEGRYQAISEALAERIETELGISVGLLPTNGSLDNLRHLQNAAADFALYQPGTLEALRKHDADFSVRGGTSAPPGEARRVAFLANLYSQPAHLIVRRGSGIVSPADLEGHRVSLGLPSSGDRALSLILLEHFNLDLEDIDAKNDLDYIDIEQAFQAGELDAALMTVGVQADVLRKLARMEGCEFLSIPHVEALARNHLHLTPYTLPQGLYGFDPTAPKEDVQTVAAGAQLLTRADVPNRLVEAVTRLVYQKEFLKANRLSELFASGQEFALHKPEFPMHPGAHAYYDPELRPLLDPGFVESTEGMISLICSAAIALFVACRWLRKGRARRKDHRLDRYIRSLLDIERRQMPLDEGSAGDDIEQLQNLLDELTQLRQEALREFTAHQLNEDRGPDCFIQMCHALSDKINAKLSRQQQNKLIRELIAAVKQGNSPRREQKEE